VTLPIRNAPHSGVYENPFWEFVQKDELRLQACSSCGQMRYPPAAVCPRCLSDHYEWSKVAGRGRIISWAIFHRKYLQLPVPYTVVSVALEEGPMLIGNIDAEPELLRLDLRVRVKYEDAQREDGHVWRIFQWELAD
jgi:uncharacterized protein